MGVFDDCANFVFSDDKQEFNDFLKQYSRRDISDEEAQALLNEIGQLIFRNTNFTPTQANLFQNQNTLAIAIATAFDIYKDSERHSFLTEKRSEKLKHRMAGLILAKAPLIRLSMKDSRYIGNCWNALLTFQKDYEVADLAVGYLPNIVQALEIELIRYRLQSDVPGALDTLEPVIKFLIATTPQNANTFH